ncbi:MAG TPA: hypothetical protein VEZ42_03970 [Pseudonocardia sp.]|jgi:hypothetical protein|nr:hypothetical protein [Pseudonocardia sp.]
MSTTTDQFTEFTARTQEVVTTAVRTWADTVQQLTDVSGSPAGVPDAAVFVDRYFDVAQQVLDTQRRLALTVLSAGTQAAETVSEQAARAAQSVTAHTKNAVDDTVTKAADAARLAGEQAASGARAARNAAKN